MNLVQGGRASNILHNFIKSNNITGCALLPANICNCIPYTIENAGMDVVYADIDARTLCLNEDSIYKLANKIDLLIFVHTYGVEEDFNFIYKKAKSINPTLKIVDDKCLCMPAQPSKNATYADVTLFSLGEKKQVPIGGAFAFINNSFQYIDQPDIPFPFETPTINFDKIDVYIKCNYAHKSEIINIYKSCLPNNICLDDIFNNWRFNIIVNNKQDILRKIFDAGLFASSHYASLSNTADIAKELHNNIINLFIDHFITKEQALDICHIINNCI